MSVSQITKPINYNNSKKPMSTINRNELTTNTSSSVSIGELSDPLESDYSDVEDDLPADPISGQSDENILNVNEEGDENDDHDRVSDAINKKMGKKRYELDDFQIIKTIGKLVHSYLIFYTTR